MLWNGQIVEHSDSSQHSTEVILMNTAKLSPVTAVAMAISVPPHLCSGQLQEI